MALVLRSILKAYSILVLINKLKNLLRTQIFIFTALAFTVSLSYYLRTHTYFLNDLSYFRFTDLS